MHDRRNGDNTNWVLQGAGVAGVDGECSPVMRFPLAFSTLGCPDWDLDQILDCATRNGYDSVELRGYRDSMDLPTAGPFAQANRAATRERFTNAGLRICCVGASANSADFQPEHVASHCALASDLGCPLVRVFPGPPSPDSSTHLRAYGDIAAAHGVAIVIETHDHGSTGAQLAALLADTQHPHVGSLWDQHHPFRQGESPEETLRQLLPTLRHVHVKDSVDGTYCLPGQGDIPIAAMLQMLGDAGWHGTVSVEWEKRWCPTLADPEIALPAYARFLHSLSGFRQNEPDAATT